MTDIAGIEIDFLEAWCRDRVDSPSDMGRAAHNALLLVEMAKAAKAWMDVQAPQPGDPPDVAREAAAIYTQLNLVLQRKLPDHSHSEAEGTGE